MDKKTEPLPLPAKGVPCVNGCQDQAECPLCLGCWHCCACADGWDGPE